MDGWKVSMLPFSVIVYERWNGKCLQNEMCLYPLPHLVRSERRSMYLAHRNQTVNRCRIC